MNVKQNKRLTKEDYKEGITISCLNLILTIFCFERVQNSVEEFLGPHQWFSVNYASVHAALGLFYQGLLRPLESAALEVHTHSAQGKD